MDYYGRVRGVSSEIEKYKCIEIVEAASKNVVLKERFDGFIWDAVNRKNELVREYNRAHV